MTTIKERINITADLELETALKQAAKKEGVPVATKAAGLIRLALELEEDLYWGAFSEYREKTHKGKYLTHEEVFGK